MSGLLLLVIAVALIYGAIGYFRVAKGAVRKFWILLVVTFAAAGLCYLIGVNKPGGSLAGIVGVVFGVMLAIAAGAYLLGGIVGYGVTGGRRKDPDQPPGPGLETYVFYALTGAALVLSLLEPGGSGTGHH